MGGMAARSRRYVFVRWSAPRRPQGDSPACGGTPQKNPPVRAPVKVVTLNSLLAVNVDGHTLDELGRLRHTHGLAFVRGVE